MRAVYPLWPLPCEQRLTISTTKQDTQARRNQNMATLSVGSGQQYATISAAVAAAHSGDVIQVQAGTYMNDFPPNVSNLTIEGVGGFAHISAAKHPPNGKAVFVTSGNVTLQNIEIS